MSILRSSVSENKLALRVKSIFLLIVPFLNALGDSFGFTLISEDAELIIDSFFVVAFVIAHAWGWIRKDLVRLLRNQ